MRPAMYLMAKYLPSKNRHLWPLTRTAEPVKNGGELCI
jgi:hypothetical protein